MPIEPQMFLTDNNQNNQPEPKVEATLLQMTNINFETIYGT